MIRKVLRILEKLKADKTKLIAEQAEIQKKIDNIDIKIKEYNDWKKGYEKLEKKFEDMAYLKKENKNE